MGGNEMKSNFLKLDTKDFLKGLVLAVLTAIITALYSLVQTGELASINVNLVLTTAISSALAYLMKNLATNSDDKILKKEIKK